ncbi:hypothetical protein VNI00_004535, partial [Paramarasmius palmivorus]
MDPKLPQELEELVIGHCQDDKPTLLACSLICRAWLRKARAIVFSSPQKLSDSTIAPFHALIHSPDCTIIPLVQRTTFLPVFDIGTDFDGFLNALERLVVHVQSSGGNLKEISTGMVFSRDLIARPEILQHLSRSVTSFSCIILITTDAPPLLEVLSALAK